MWLCPFLLLLYPNHTPILLRRQNLRVNYAALMSTLTRNSIAYYLFSTVSITIVLIGPFDKKNCLLKRLMVIIPTWWSQYISFLPESSKEKVLLMVSMRSMINGGSSPTSLCMRNCSIATRAERKKESFGLTILGNALSLVYHASPILLFLSNVWR